MGSNTPIEDKIIVRRASTASLLSEDKHRKILGTDSSGVGAVGVSEPSGIVKNVNHEKSATPLQSDKVKLICAINANSTNAASGGAPMTGEQKSGGSKSKEEDADIIEIELQKLEDEIDALEKATWKAEENETVLDSQLFKLQLNIQLHYPTIYYGTNWQAWTCQSGLVPVSDDGAGHSFGANAGPSSSGTVFDDHGNACEVNNKCNVMDEDETMKADEKDKRIESVNEPAVKKSKMK
ncbi:hypothetical protein L5515_018667 [Caenorhabditis briggsae]|uniref:Uncharacterized protein n=1 Tax=Caenorhabditis briggsae TaxID=6238 RepID=A0AAE9FC20_CAEBR|nr:hypothetical protein L5515_018667 [Caenorhabditis briggsae]